MSNRRNRSVQPDRDGYSGPGGSQPNFNGQQGQQSGNNQQRQPNSNNQQGQQGQQGFNGQPNINNLGQLLNNIDLNQVMGQLSQMMGGPPPGPMQSPMQPPRPVPRDPRLDLLQAIKPFLPVRRGLMLDRIGQFYLIIKMFQDRNKK